MNRLKNNPSSINSQDLERHLQQVEFSNRIKSDRFFYVLLLSIGLGGLYFTTNTDHQVVRNEESMLPGFEEEQDAHIPSATEKADQSLMARKPLVISQIREALEPLRFTIDSFDKDAKYKLHLGNGIVLIVNQKHTFYTYETAGIYNIKLEVNYDDRNENLVIYDEPIQILRGIEIAGS